MAAKKSTSKRRTRTSASKKRSKKTGQKRASSKATKSRSSKKKPSQKETEPIIQQLTTSIPAKTPPTKAEAISFSTHKARSGWFNARESWPLREPPTALLMGARTRTTMSMPVSPGMAKWREAGPTNIGGRMTCLVIRPDDPARIIAGSAGGGIWSSDDGGVSWTARWHSEPTLNIGSLCLDPADPDVIYCGTGEANLSADSHPGVGIFRSIDGGIAWHPLAPASAHGLPTRIGRVAIDPFDSDRILIGGVSHVTGDPRGLFASRDGGSSWARVNSLVNAPCFCHEVLFSPDVQDTVYVAIDAIGFSNGIWRSTDGGTNWTQLTSGLPSAPSIRRTSLAIAPSNSNVIYAQMANFNGGVLGVFRSANGGNTWKSIGGTHFGAERQMNYNNTISINPTDENDVICGGVDLHRSKNGGTTWKSITDWRARRGLDSNYAHADQHFVRHAAGQSGLVYAMNDGGMDVSTDGGDDWVNRSNGLATNMFYDLAAAASDGNMYGGGMQDNGTWVVLDGKPESFIELTGGDGGFCAIDPNDKFHLYTSSQRMRINRFRTSDRWGIDIGPPETGPRPWMAFIAMDPDRPKRVLVGSQRVWRTLNDASSWTDMTGILDNSFVTCIEISRADTDRIYVGTENGGVFRSDDGGSTWTDNIASSTLPGRTITRLRTPADDADVVYATVANFGNRHLFRSTDAGGTWQDVDAGNLPDVPHHGIAIPSDNSDVVYVGGDAGVFVSDDAGASWHNLTLNLPTVMVVDLVLHEATDVLLAATYGRSIWKLDVSQI